MSCVFKDAVGCKTCNHLIFSECFEFRKMQVKYLIKDVLPLSLSKEDLLKYGNKKAYFTTNLVTATKFAASTAIHHRKVLKKLTLNQLISMALDGSDLMHKVYLVTPSKVSEQVKIQSCAESMVDKMLMNGCTVVLVGKSGCLNFSDNWTLL